MFYLTNINIVSTDKLNVTVNPAELEIGNGTTANFTAIASGISTVENNFMYPVQFMKHYPTRDLQRKLLKACWSRGLDLQ